MTKAKKRSASGYLYDSWRFLCANRRSLRGSYGEYLLVALVFIAATIVYTNFVAFHITDQLFTSGPGDATAGFLWLNFANHSLSPFIPNIDLTNYPDGQQLGGATFITYLALWLPIRVLSYFFGAVAGLNLVTFFGFISAGLSMYWLLKRLTGSWLVALFAGYAAAFVPYAVSKSSAHLAYIFSVVFVLIIAGFIALWSRPTKLRAVLLGLSIALAFYTDGYYLLLGTVTVFGLMIAGVLQGVITGMTKNEYWSRFKYLVLAGVCVVLTVIPIAYVQVSQGKDVQQTLSESRPDISKEIIAYRSNIMDFIVPPAENAFFKDNSEFQTIQSYKNLRSNHSESLNYIGFTLIGLMGVGGALLIVLLFAKKFSSLKKVDDPTKKKFILLGCICAVTIPLFLAFMFSPEVSVAGHTIPLPGKFFIDHNIALWRVMSRFFVPLHVVIVIFAAFSLWLALTPLRAKKQTAIIANGIVVVLIVILGLEYATTMYRPSFSFKDIPAVYGWLEKRSDIQTAAELPIVDPLDFHTTRYFTAQVVHKKKLVNKKEPDAERLSNVIGSVDNPEAIDWAYQRGAQAIITHGTNCEPEKWGEIVYKDDSKPFGKLCVYKLEKPETHDKTFVRFDGKGFKYVSTPDSDMTTIGVESSNSIMTVVGTNLMSPVKGEVKVTGSIEPLLNGTFQGMWRLSQDNKTIARGDISNSKATIDAKVNAEKPVFLELRRNDGQPYVTEDLAIHEVIATSY
jgi:hypothetical protein